MTKDKTFPGKTVTMDAAAQEHGVLFLAEDGEIIWHLELERKPPRGEFRAWGPAKVTWKIDEESKQTRDALRAE